MKRFISLFARCTLMALLVMTVTTQSAFACVGKSLIIGALDNTQQQVLAQMLSILISERTGTSVKVVLIDGHEEAHEALLRADLDMYVEYTGIGQVVLLQDEPIADSKALFEAVKGRTVADAAPVVRKDTLKKFPALARLINKLGGVIDAEAMETLEKACNEASSREVARNFLKQNRFI